MSAVPPGGKPTKIRTGRAGYSNADAVRDVADNAAAAAANCKKSLRGSFMAFSLCRAQLAPGALNMRMMKLSMPADCKHAAQQSGLRLVQVAANAKVPSYDILRMHT